MVIGASLQNCPTIGVADGKGVAVGVALGDADGVADGVRVGVALGVADGVTDGLAVGVALGVADGVALGVTDGVADGVTLGVALGLADGVALGVTDGVAEAVAVGVALGVADGVGVGFGGGVLVSLNTKLNPLANDPWSPPASSTIYNDHTPCASVPSKTDNGVLLPGFGLGTGDGCGDGAGFGATVGAGVGNVSPVPKLVGRNAPLVICVLSGNGTAASSSTWKLRFTASPLPPASDKMITLCPCGPTSSISTSSGNVCEKPFNSTFTSVTGSGATLVTAICNGYGQDTPLVVPVHGIATVVGLEKINGVPVGVAVGVPVGVTLGVAEGVTLGLADGVALGVAEGVADGLADGVALGVTLGVAVGLGHPPPPPPLNTKQ